MSEEGVVRSSTERTQVVHTPVLLERENASFAGMAESRMGPFEPLDRADWLNHAVHSCHVSPRQRVEGAERGPAHHRIR